MFAATRGWAPVRSVVLVALTLGVLGVGCRPRSAAATDGAGQGGETVGTATDEGSEARQDAARATPQGSADAAEGAPVAEAEPPPVDAEAPTTDPSDGADDDAQEEAVRVSVADPTDGVSEPRRAVLPGSAHAVDPALTAAIRRIMAPIRACYQEELARNPAFHGADPPPTVRPVEGRNGTVRLTLVGSSGSARVDRCLRQALRRMSYSRDDRPVHVQYPFLFTPEGAPRDLPVGG